MRLLFIYGSLHPRCIVGKAYEGLYERRVWVDKKYLQKCRITLPRRKAENSTGLSMQEN